MCLVISVLLTALGVNFYVNGFMAQAYLMGAMSLFFLMLMVRNISCKKNNCAIKKDKHKEDEKNDLDFEDRTQLDLQEVEKKS